MTDNQISRVFLRWNTRSPHSHDVSRSSSSSISSCYHSSTLSLQWGTLNSSVSDTEEKWSRLRGVEFEAGDHEAKNHCQTASTRLDTGGIRRGSRRRLESQRRQGRLGSLQGGKDLERVREHFRIFGYKSIADQSFSVLPNPRDPVVHTCT